MSCTCEHIRKKIAYPVHSPTIKLMRGQSVVEWLTNSELCLLHVCSNVASVVVIMSGLDCGCMWWTQSGAYTVFCFTLSTTWPHPGERFLSAR